MARSTYHIGARAVEKTGQNVLENQEFYEEERKKLRGGSPVSEGTQRPRDASSQGHIIQGRNVQGHNVTAPPPLYVT
jgi:hypothetical protein